MLSEEDDEALPRLRRRGVLRRKPSTTASKTPSRENLSGSQQRPRHRDAAATTAHTGAGRSRRQVRRARHDGDYGTPPTGRPTSNLHTTVNSVPAPGELFLSPASPHAAETGFFDPTHQSQSPPTYPARVCWGVPSDSGSQAATAEADEQRTVRRDETSEQEGPPRAKARHYSTTSSRPRRRPQTSKASRVHQRTSPSLLTRRRI